MGQAIEYDGDDIGHDPYRDRPRKSSRREVATCLNRLAVGINGLHELLSHLRHELHVDESLTAMVTEHAARESIPTTPTKRPRGRR